MVGIKYHRCTSNITKTLKQKYIVLLTLNHVAPFKAKLENSTLHGVTQRTLQQLQGNVFVFSRFFLSQTAMQILKYENTISKATLVMSFWAACHHWVEAISYLLNIGHGDK